MADLHPLFSYGTLQQPDVQCAIFGQELTGYPDVLGGCRLEDLTIVDPQVIAASGKTIHQILIPDRDGPPIHGTRYHLDDDQLAAADRYEVGDYTRIEVTLASGQVAWVYAMKPPGPMSRQG